MNEYTKQAKDFLQKANAKMQINYCDCIANDLWNATEMRNVYDVTIITRKGKMFVRFWDSIFNTENSKKPNEYDILACLQKYDIGSLDDFMSDFGYEAKCTKDIVYILSTYSAVYKEYKDLCRIFTPEQIEELREIN